MTNLLTIRHAHPRDANIQFQEEGHKYTILTDLKSKYTSVTTWNHSHFAKFDSDAVIASMMKGKNWNPTNKYWGLTADQIKKQWADNGKEVASEGTKMHYQIECILGGVVNPNNSSKKGLPLKYTHRDLLDYYVGERSSPQTPPLNSEHGIIRVKRSERQVPLEEQIIKKEGSEGNYVPLEGLFPPHFMKFMQDFPNLVPYRTEWLIYDEELKLSGSIDMVYENQEDGTLSIYDWKRCKSIDKTNGWNKFAITECISHLPDSNFWHYSLQLNTYKMILERNYGKKVTALYLVRLHPDSTTYELIKVPNLENEMADLIEGERSSP